jgi:hypothetical protein
MRLRIALAVSCVGAWGLGAAVRAQEPAKPTDEHKILAADVGTWDASIKSYMAGPNSEPTMSKGTEVNEMLEGGLWLLSKFDGEFGGAKFHGRGQFGYDPAKKKYVATWVDSMSASISLMDGTYDAKTKTMTYVTDGVTPDGKTKYTQKMVTTAKDDHTRVFTLSMKMEGAPEDTKTMEVTYTRRK